MKTAENKTSECQNEEQSKKNNWKFILGVAAGIILYVSYQLFIK